MESTLAWPIFKGKNHKYQQYAVKYKDVIPVLQKF